MRDDFRRAARAGLTFNAPLSEERAGALVAALPISPGHHVLDLGCGAGELLLRILAAHPATTGTGVDTERRRSTEAFSRRPGVACTGGSSSWRPIPRPSSTSPTSSCASAASYAWGGVGAALHWLRECVAPGGRLLFGDGFWAGAPTPAALTAVGELPRLEDVHAAAAAAGFRIERDEVSTMGEWDAFETSWRSGLEGSPLPGPPPSLSNGAASTRTAIELRSASPG